MVFESLVASLLEKYLGQFVKNFNSNDLNIGVFSGKVSLRNLELRPDALQSLDLPLAVRAGFIGEVELDIPFRSLSSQPVVVSIDRIFLVASTKSEFKPPVKDEETLKRELTQKLEMLKQHEQTTFGASKDATATAQEDGFTSRLIQKIVDNLQVIIRRIHVRFEDTTEPERPNSLGLVIQEISAVTTDPSFSNVQFSIGQRVVCKRLSIQGFGIYLQPWDVVSFANRVDALDEVFSATPSQTASAHSGFRALLPPSSSSSSTALTKAASASSASSPAASFVFANSSSSTSSSGRLWTYLMPPVSISLHVRMHRQPRVPPAVPDPSEPEADIEVKATLDPIFLRLTHSQYHSLLSCINSIGNAQRYGKYLCRRPKVSSGSVRSGRVARQFWHHAIQCVLHDVREHRARFNFRDIIDRSQDRKRYSQLYKGVLNSPTSTALTQIQKDQLTVLETRYTYDEIVFFRKLTAAEVRLELRGREEVSLRKASSSSSSSGSSGGGFFSRWFGGGSSSSSSSSAGSEDSGAGKPLTKEELQQVYEIVKFDPNGSKNVQVAANHKLLEISLSIPVGSIELATASSQPFVRVLFSATRVQALKYPDTLAVQAALGAFGVENCVDNTSVIAYDEKLANSTQLSQSNVSSSSKSSSQSLPLLSVEFVSNPTDSKIGAHSRLRVSLQPLQVYFDRKLVESLINYFTATAAVNTDWMTEAVWNQVEEIRKSTRASVADALKEHRIMELDISLSAPVLIFPEDAAETASPITSSNIRAPTSALSPSSLQLMGRRLVANLGRLKLTSRRSADAIQDLSASLKSHLPSFEEDMWSSHYDALQIDIDDMEVYLTKGYDSHQDRTFLLNPMSLQVNMLPSVALSLTGDYPQVLLQAVLPQVAVRLSPGALRGLVSVLSTAATPIPVHLLPVPPPAAKLAERMLLESARLKSGSTHSRRQIQAAVDDLMEAELNESALDVVKRRVMMTKKIAVIDFHVPEISFTLCRDTPERDPSSLPVLPRLSAISKSAISSSSSTSSIAADSSSNSDHVLLFKLSHMNTSIIKRPYDLAVSLQLGSIGLDNTVIPIDKQFQRVISTTEHSTNADVSSNLFLSSSSSSSSSTSSSFVSVEFSQTDRLSPEWTSVAQRLRVEIGQVTLGVHPRSLHALVAFIMSDLVPAKDALSETAKARLNLNRQPESSGSSSSTASSINTTEDDLERQDMLEKMLAARQGKPQPRNAITSIDLKFHFDSLCLQLFTESSLDLYGVSSSPPPFVEARIRHIAVNFIKYPHAFDINLALWSIALDYNVPSSLFITSSGRTPELGYRTYSIVNSLSEDRQSYSNIRALSDRAASKFASNVADGNTEMFNVQPRKSGDAEKMEISPLVLLSMSTFARRDAEFPGHDSILAARLSGLKFIYLNRFVQEMILYTLDGPLGHLIFYPPAAPQTDNIHPPASTSTQQQQSSVSSTHSSSNNSGSSSSSAPVISSTDSGVPFATAVEQMPFMQLHLLLSDIELLVPRHSDATDAIVARIDQIGLKNQLSLSGSAFSSHALFSNNKTSGLSIISSTDSIAMTASMSSNYRSSFSSNASDTQFHDIPARASVDSAVGSKQVLSPQKSAVVMESFAFPSGQSSSASSAATAASSSSFPHFAPTNYDSDADEEFFDAVEHQGSLSNSPKALSLASRSASVLSLEEEFFEVEEGVNALSSSLVRSRATSRAPSTPASRIMSRRSSYHSITSLTSQSNTEFFDIDDDNFQQQIQAESDGYRNSENSLDSLNIGPRRRDSEDDDAVSFVSAQEEFEESLSPSLKSTQSRLSKSKASSKASSLSSSLTDASFLDAIGPASSTSASSPASSSHDNQSSTKLRARRCQQFQIVAEPFTITLQYGVKLYSLSPLQDTAIRRSTGSLDSGFDETKCTPIFILPAFSLNFDMESNFAPLESVLAAMSRQRSNNSNSEMPSSLSSSFKSSSFSSSSPVISTSSSAEASAINLPNMKGINTQHPIQISSSMRLTLDLTTISVLLSQRQYVFVMTMLSGNLAETSLVIDPLLKTHRWSPIAERRLAELQSENEGEEMESDEVEDDENLADEAEDRFEGDPISSARSPAPAKFNPVSSSSQSNMSRAASKPKLSGLHSIMATLPTPRSTLTVQFSAAAMRLELLRGTGLRAEIDSLITFQLTKFSAWFQKQGDAMEAQVSFGGVELADSSIETARAGVPVNFRRLLLLQSAQDGSGVANPLSVRFVKTPVEGIHLDLDIHHVQLGFAGVLYSLGSFFTLPASTVHPSKPSQGSSHALTQASAQQLVPEPAVSPSASRTPMQIRARIVHASFHLIVSPTQMLSRALVLSWKVQTRFVMAADGQMSIGANMLRCQALHVYLDASKSLDSQLVFASVQSASSAVEDLPSNVSTLTSASLLTSSLQPSTAASSSNLEASKSSLSSSSLDNSMVIKPFSVDALVRIDGSSLVSAAGTPFHSSQIQHVSSNHRLSNTALSKPGSRIRVEAALGLIDVCWTYKDYRLVLDATREAVKPPVSTHQEEDQNASCSSSISSEFSSTLSLGEKPSASSAAVTASLENESKHFDEATSVPASNITDENIGALVSYGDMNVSLNVAGLSLLLINDCTSVEVPILRMDVSSVDVGLIALAQSRRIRAGFSLTIDYFNNRRVAWEPLLESLKPTLLINQSAYAAGGSPCTDLSLVCDQNIDINFSHAMLDGVLASLELLTRVESKLQDDDYEIVQSVSSKEKFSPNRLLNQTGWPLLFSMSGTDAPNMLLVASESCAITFPPSIHARQRTISIGFPRFWAPLHHVQVDQVGNQTRVLRSIAEAIPDVELVFEVSVIDGLKVISVHSTQSVENQTGFPLDIMGTICPPGQTFWLPLLQNDPNMVAASMVSSPSSPLSVSATPSVAAEQQVLFQPLLELKLRPSLRSSSSSEPNEAERKYAEEFTPSKAISQLISSQNYLRPKSIMIPSMIQRSAPSDSMASHLWSAPIACNSDEEIHRIACAPVPSSGLSTLYFTVQVQRSSAGMSSAVASSSFVQFKVCPPFTFDNLLACDVELRVFIPEAAATARHEEMRRQRDYLSASSASSLPAAASSSSGELTSIEMDVPLLPVISEDDSLSVSSSSSSSSSSSESVSSDQVSLTVDTNAPPIHSSTSNFASSSQSIQKSFSDINSSVNTKMVMWWSNILLPREKTLACHEFDPTQAIVLSIHPLDLKHHQKPQGGPNSSFDWSSTTVIDQRRISDGKDVICKLNVAPNSSIEGGFKRQSLIVNAELGFPNGAGSRFITLFSPYWIYNLTSSALMFSDTKSEVTFDSSMPPSLDQHDSSHHRGMMMSNRLDGNRFPVMFNWTPQGMLASLVELATFQGKHLYMRTPTSDWSPPMSVDSVGARRQIDFMDAPLSTLLAVSGAEGDIRESSCTSCLTDEVDEVKSLNKVRPLLEFGVSVELAPGRYNTRTKVIRITPRFVVVNQLPQPIQLRQCDTDAYGIRTLSSAASASHDSAIIPSQSKFLSSSPFHWIDHEMSHAVRFRVMEPLAEDERSSSDTWLTEMVDEMRYMSEKEIQQQSQWLWSGDFEIDKPGDSVLRTRHRRLDHPDRFIQVEVRPVGATVFVIFSEADSNFPPYLIENRSVSESFRFAQRDTQLWQVVPPMQEKAYAWDHPLGVKQLSLTIFGDEQAERHFDIESDESIDGNEHLAIVSLTQSERNLFIYRELRGPVCVLVISDFPNPDTKQPEFQALLANRASVLDSKLSQLRVDVTRLLPTIENLRQLLEKERAHEEARLLINDGQPLTNFVAVQVMEARDLEAAGVGGHNNVYALATMGQQQFRTHTMKQTLNPLWNSPIFPFVVSDEAHKRLELPLLKIALFQANQFCEDEFLGGVAIDIDPAEMRYHRIIDAWFALSPLRVLPTIKGDVRLRIQWVSSPSKLLSLLLREQESLLQSKQVLLDRVEKLQSLLHRYENGSSAESSSELPSVGPVLRRQSSSKTRRSSKASAPSKVESQLKWTLSSSQRNESSSLSTSAETKRSSNQKQVMLSRARSQGTGSSNGVKSLKSIKKNQNHRSRRPSFNSMLSSEAEGLPISLVEEPEAEVQVHLAGLKGNVVSRFTNSSRVFAIFSFGQEQCVSLLKERTVKDSGAAFARMPIQQSRQMFRSDTVLDDSFPDSIVLQQLQQKEDSPLKQNEPAKSYQSIDIDSALNDPLISASPGQNSYTMFVPEAWIQEKRSDATLAIRVYEENDEGQTACIGIACLPPWIVSATDRSLAWQNLLSDESSSAELIWLQLFQNESESIENALQPISAPGNEDSQDQQLQLHSRKPRPSINSLGQIGVKMVRHQALPWDQKPKLKACVALTHFGVSIIDQSPRELLYLSILGTTASFESAPSQQNIEFAMQQFQIDNQVAINYPVLFAPRRTSAEKNVPFIQFSANKSVSASQSVQLFSFLSVLIQEFDIQVEEALIWQILEFVNQFGSRAAKVAESTQQQQLSVPNVHVNMHENYTLPSGQSSKLFFHFLQLQPLSLTLSFQANPKLRKRHGHFEFNPFDVLLRVAGAAFGSIDHAPLRINALVLERAFGGISLFTSSLTNHFIQQGITQLYNIIGSFEFLGNPVDTVSKLGSGVKDFFYEPAEGLMQSPAQFGRGLIKGSSSLLRNSVSGLFGAAAKVTASLGRGAAILSGDQEYFEEYGREAGGLAASAKNFGTSIVRGIKGVIADPLKGARQEGVTGFLKGLGTGVVGLAARPISGLLNFSSKAFQYVRNAASQELVQGRLRPPRFIAPDGVLRKFDLQESLLWATFKTFVIDGTIPHVSIARRSIGAVDDSQLAEEDLQSKKKTENPIVFAEPNENSLLFVTDKRFLFLTRPNQTQPYSLGSGWSIASHLVRRVSCRDNAIRIFYAKSDDQPCLDQPKEIRTDKEDIASSTGLQLRNCVFQVQVERALYGTPGHWADVTEALRNRLQMYGTTSVHQHAFKDGNWYNELFQSDPCPGRHKLLLVDYLRQGVPTSAVFRENHPIIL